MKLALPFAIVVAVAPLALADQVDPFANRVPPKKQPQPRDYHGLGADSVTPEVVAKFAPPPLDPSVSRHIQSMLDIRGAGGGLLTSKGDRMIFNWRVTGQTAVWRQDGPMKFPVQLTGGEDNTSAIAVAPDDSFIVVSRDVGGQENPGVYLQALDGGPLRVVQHAAKVQTSLAYVSDDSKSVYFRANDLDPASYALYRFDVKAGTKDRVFDQPGLWALAAHSGNRWLLVKELGSDHVEVYSYDLDKKALVPLLGQNEKEEYDVDFGANDAVLVRTNKLGDFQRLYRLDAGALVAITPEMKHDVTSYAIDHARKHIYYSVGENGYAHLHALDAKTYKELPLPKLADADNVQLAGLSRDGRYAQLQIDGATLLPQTVVYDWQTKKLVTWRQPNAPDIDTSAFAKLTLETYPARDGTAIPMFVRRPQKCAVDPCPVIVEFHGGPEGQATAGFNPRAQMFVDAGFVFVQPNVRGSVGYGKAWLHADDGAKRLNVITDIEDCAKYIRSAWAKDGKAPKLGVTGGSYGGYATLMAMTYFAGAYDAGVEIVGISNLVTFLENTAPYRRILRISEYGDPVKDRDALVQLSPVTHVDKVKAPLLLVQGVNDPRVPVGEAMQIYDRLVERKVPVGMILFADEGHGASKRGNIVAMIGHTIAFFQKHLLGK